jgi:hypothetical protein
MQQFQNHSTDSLQYRQAKWTNFLPFMKTLRLSSRANWPALSHMNLLHIPTTNLFTNHFIISIPTHTTSKQSVVSSWLNVYMHFWLFLDVSQPCSSHPPYAIHCNMWQTMELFFIPPWHECVWKRNGKILHCIYLSITQQPYSSYLHVVWQQWSCPSGTAMYFGSRGIT